MSTVPPINREILVAADPATAFEIFTDRIGAWWPLGEHGVYGGQSTVAFEDGVLVERSNDQQSVWGTVTEWEPPYRLALTWHPGDEPDTATLVTVSFDAAGDQTLVRLVHSGWEARPDAAVAREEYEAGWPPVIDRFADLVSHTTDPTAGTWVALLHAPGPAGPTEGTVFADPRFGDHVEFLADMQQRGYLVAAGPLADEDGAGMTVLRIPGDDRYDEATRLATEVDASVAGGFFTVTVRPWLVQLAG